MACLVGIADAQNLGRERRLERREEAREQYPDLTKSLQNPLARILSIPTRFEYLDGEGAEQVGESFALRIAPRVPFVLNADWHIISKTDVAWKQQRNVIGSTEQQGLTDLSQTFFFSPDRSLGWDVYWGVGPTFVLPTATDDFLGTEKWSLGPSAAVYKQTDRWIAGVLLNHTWSVAGSTARPSINISRMEPLFAYTAPTATTFAMSAEVNHDWRQEKWLVPLELRVSQLTMIKQRPIQWSLGAKKFFGSLEGAADWGAYFQVTLPLQSPRWGRE